MAVDTVTEGVPPPGPARPDLGHSWEAAKLRQARLDPGYFSLTGEAQSGPQLLRSTDDLVGGRGGS